MFILIMSWTFYAAWNLPYLLILLISTVVDYVAAKQIYAAPTKAQKRVWLTVSLIANLGMLSYFKYGEFLLDNTVTLLATVGIEYQPAPWSVLLPIGISFFTFQTMTYSLDVFRGRMKPDASLLDFAVFVSFFPQLVAGPIVRARSFIPQLKVQPTVSMDQLGWALVLFSIGLFEKVVLADGILAPIVDQTYNTAHYNYSSTPAASQVIFSNFAFMGQIFGDFGGYSLMAIAVALSLGFKLPDNFRAPFAAIGVVDFWQRWHISMSTWFRDYLYANIRSRKNKSLTNVMYAQFLTMTIIGLWHGASWTFVIWGMFNGLVIATELALKRGIGHWHIWQWRVSKLFLWALTMTIFSQSTLLFRAEDLDQSIHLFGAALGAYDTGFAIPKLEALLAAGCIGGLFFMHWLIRHRPLRELVDALPMPVTATVWTLGFLAIATIGVSSGNFIYFQF